MRVPPPDGLAGASAILGLVSGGQKSHDFCYMSHDFCYMSHDFCYMSHDFCYEWKRLRLRDEPKRLVDRLGDGRTGFVVFQVVQRFVEGFGADWAVIANIDQRL